MSKELLIGLGMVVAAALVGYAFSRLGKYRDRSADKEDKQDSAGEQERRALATELATVAREKATDLATDQKELVERVGTLERANIGIKTKLAMLWARYIKGEDQKK